MSDQEKFAKNIQRFREAVFSHDRLNPTHTSYGIGLAYHDMERLGLEEAEVLWREPHTITVHADGGQASNFRVLCDGEHDEASAAQAEEAEAITKAVGVEVGA